MRKATHRVASGGAAMRMRRSDLCLDVLPQLLCTSSSCVEAAATAAPAVTGATATRGFVIPNQLKAYGDDFSPSRGMRNQYLMPHTALKDAKKLQANRRTKAVESFDDMGLPQQVRRALSHLLAETPQDARLSLKAITERIHLEDADAANSMAVLDGANNNNNNARHLLQHDEGPTPAMAKASSALPRPPTAFAEPDEEADFVADDAADEFDAAAIAAREIATTAAAVSSSGHAVGASQQEGTRGCASAFSAEADAARHAASLRRHRLPPLPPPSPVQQVAMRPILDGHSTLIAAPCGTGKTIAYLAPLYARMLRDRDVFGVPTREHRPRTIIMAPTKELLLQIHNVCKAFDAATGLNSVCFPAIRGRKHRRWRKMMRRSMPDVLVVHPHFALRQIEAKRLFIDDLRHVVLDEADDLVSTTSNRLGVRLAAHAQRRAAYAHLWPARTQMVYSTSGVTRELEGFIRSRERDTVTVIAPGSHLPADTGKHHFYRVKREAHKLDYVRYLLTMGGTHPTGVPLSTIESREERPPKKREDEDSEGHAEDAATTKRLKRSSLAKRRRSARAASAARQLAAAEALRARYGLADPTSVVTTGEADASAARTVGLVQPESTQTKILNDNEEDSLMMVSASASASPAAAAAHAAAAASSGSQQNDAAPMTPAIIERHQIAHRPASVRWEHLTTVSAPFTCHVPFSVEGAARGARTIIYCRTVDRATAIYHHLLRHGYTTTTLLHGTLPSAVREENYRAFASGASNILVSTDMTARGLDLRVDKVINFDMPTSPIPYLNRAGRTARMGRTGDVISLYTKQQRVIVSALRKFIARRIRLEGVSNVASEMVRPRYAEWKLQKIDATARKFVQLVNTRIIPAHLEKTYIRHNAMWRPLFHPDTAGIHGGVPVHQQKKIKARVREAAIWFRRQKLADRKGGMAKFGRTKALVRRTDGSKGLQAGPPAAGAASLSRPMPAPPK